MLPYESLPNFTWNTNTIMIRRNVNYLKNPQNPQTLNIYQNSAFS